MLLMGYYDGRIGNGIETYNQFLSFVRGYVLALRNVHLLNANRVC